jgi:RNA polymerase sigma-70 factor (subfamily 1)
MHEAQPNSSETQGLLRQVHAGNRQAVEPLFARHQAYLHRLVGLRLDPRLRSRVDPSDIVQEAYLEALNRLEAYLDRPALPFRLWLRQIAVDRAQKALRHHLGTARRAVGREVPLPERSSAIQAGQLLAGGPTPSQQLNRRELARRLRQAVAQMAPEEAAAQIRRRPATVRATLVAARDHWLILARHQKAAEADWLERVLSTADPDPWRQSGRAARGRDDRQALEKLAREVDVGAQPPEALFVIELGLRQRGAHETAVALLRRAQEIFPSDFWINHDLGMALQDSRPSHGEEAIRFLTVAVALRPQSAGGRFNLGAPFLDQGRLDEAIGAFRKAIELKPDDASAYNDLGNAFWEKGRLDEAVAAYRRTIELTPDFAPAHFNLGLALAQMDRLDEAIIAFRRAIALKADFAEAHCNLGSALRQQGKFAQARDAFQQGHELGSRRPARLYPSAQWVKECQRLVELDETKGRQ